MEDPLQVCYFDNCVIKSPQKTYGKTPDELNELWISCKGICLCTETVIDNSK